MCHWGKHFSTRGSKDIVCAQLVLTRAFSMSLKCSTLECSRSIRCRVSGLARLLLVGYAGTDLHASTTLTSKRPPCLTLFDCQPYRQAWVL